MATRKGPVYDDDGKQICGAKTKSRVTKKGKKRTNKICKRSPMKNNRCHLHGGKSTGPKNSIAYYRKILKDENNEVYDIENPIDLAGELGFVRQLLTKMLEDPLRTFCQDCSKWVTAEVSCPNKEYANQRRSSNGKSQQNHHVFVRDNDHSTLIKSTKLLSDIAKNHKEIQKGKEITLKIEVINFVVNRIVEAYELAEQRKEPNERRRVFVENVERLIVDANAGEVAERIQKA